MRFNPVVNVLWCNKVSIMKPGKKKKISKQNEIKYLVLVAANLLDLVEGQYFLT